MSLEVKIRLLRRFLFDIVKPSISELFEVYNREEFVGDWKRNCCKQTSILTNALLKEFLIGKFGYQKIESWEGYFTDIFNGKKVEYDHCWIYCINENPHLNLFVDIARNHKPLLCYFTPRNEYPEYHPSYKDQRMFDKDYLDADKLLRENEYFTGMPAARLLFRLKLFMSKQESLRTQIDESSLDLSEFKPRPRYSKATDIDILDAFI